MSEKFQQPKNVWATIEQFFSILGIQDLTPSNATEVAPSLLISQVKKGCHIAVTGGQSITWHHGIYIGKKNDIPMVIDMYGPNGKQSVKIAERPFEEFMRSATRCAIVNYSNDTKESRLATYQAACLATRSMQPDNLYNLFSSNCECFAVWCRTGRYDLFLTANKLLQNLPFTPYQKSGFKFY